MPCNLKYYSGAKILINWYGFLGASTLLSGLAWLIINTVQQAKQMDIFNNTLTESFNASSNAFNTTCGALYSDAGVPTFVANMSLACAEAYNQIPSPLFFANSYLYLVIGYGISMACLAAFRDSRKLFSFKSLTCCYCKCGSDEQQTINSSRPASYTIL